MALAMGLGMRLIICCALVGCGAPLPATTPTQPSPSPSPGSCELECDTPPVLDTCSSSSVGGLRLTLKTSEAVRGTISGTSTCAFSSAGDVLVNLAFFTTSGCAVPTAGASYRFTLTGDVSGGTSALDLSYAGAAPPSGAGVSIGYLAGGITATTDMQLDHLWVTDDCSGGVNVTSNADIGAPQAGAPLAAIEITIGPN